MTRQEWKNTYSAMRKTAYKFGSESIWFDHGGTHWRALVNHRQGMGLVVFPTIIRDRSISSRIHYELFWAADYRAAAKRHRSNGGYWDGHAKRCIEGAKACLADARELRLAGSALHQIAFE